MNVIPKDLTIHSLLFNPTEQLVVPSYQRRYAWGYMQTYALFEDIDMLQPNDGHLFGMLILHTGMHHGGINTIDVVDGQQRITTISLLLNSLRQKFKTLNNDFNVAQIDNMLTCGGTEKDRKQKIILGELDNLDYQRLLTYKTSNITNQKLLEAHQQFIKLINERINEEGEDWLLIFYQKLVHTAKIIRLDVQQAQDAYKLFETINNRGLRLSATDILKNFILGHAAKINKEKLEEVKGLWSEIITNLDGIPTDDFFRQYVSSIYTRKITKSKVIEEFKNHYFKNVNDVEKLGEYMYNADYYGDTEGDLEDDEEDPNQEETSYEPESEANRVDIVEYIQEIVSAAECYAKIWNQKFDDFRLNRKLKDLSEIKSFPAYIFLMHYLQRKGSISEKLKVIDILSAIMLRRHVCARRTSENDDIFAKLLRINDDDNDFILNVEKELVEDYPEDDEFIDRFPTHELKGNLIPRAKYILSQIEYFKTGDTGELTVNSGNEVHLEHIIPQKITPNNWKRKYGDWEEYLGEKAAVKHRKIVNRIGNMTLLSGELNISASNNPFSRKKKCYRNSNISITKELGEDYSQFKFHNVDKRGKEFAEIASQIWKIR